MRDRFAALANAYRMTAEVDPRLNLHLALAVAVPLVVGVVVAAVTGAWVIWVPVAVLVALLAALLVFGRRVQAAQFRQIEGVPGAAAAVLQNMRGQWWVQPAIGVTTKQEMVHRVVGRPGIVLVTEGGNSQRVKALIAREKKKLGRVASDVPLHVLHAGDGTDGTVELSKLQVELTRLGNSLSKTEVPKLAKKLAPLDKGNVPMPKGAVPRHGNRPR